MTQRLWVGSRKGLFRLDEQSSGWAISHVSFLGHPVSMVFDDARDSSVYAALNLGHFGVKLHRSTDAGQSWTEVGVPTYPAQGGGDGPSLKQIWSLEAAGPNASDGLWAGTIPGGLFFSADAGASWTLNHGLWDRPERAAWFGGGADHPGIHSICVDPRDHQHVLIAVSCGGAWRTRDGGVQWELGGPGMIAEYMPPDQQDNPAIQDPHRMVQCPLDPDVLWVQHHNGVFRSTDWAASWQTVSGLSPSSFGFGVVVHPQQSQTAWFVPAQKDELRIPVGGRLSVTRTRDGGQTCEVLTNGLPTVDCYDLVYRHALDIDHTGQRLAFGSTTGNVWTTHNGGDEWTPLPAHLPPIYVVRFGPATAPA
jgi:hypothetical protein